MKLTASKRALAKKSDAKQLRRAGDVPAILYSPGQPAEPIAIKSDEMSTVLRKIQPGQLGTTTFTLLFGSKERKAIIKDIQYHPTTYIVEHLDFEELMHDVPVVVRVPIVFTGVNECVGVKLGGFLRQIVRNIQIKCLPKDIPQEFSIDVRDLGIRQSRRLSDITLPEKVKPVTSLEEVIVVVAKR